MVAYLIDITLIWGIGLLAYYVFFKNEKFHGYNRLYLSTIIMTGLVLPKISLPAFAERTSHVTQQLNVHQYLLYSPNNGPLNSISTVGQSTMFSTTDILLYIYFIGVVVSVSMLLKEALKLITLYKNATHTKYGSQTIVSSEHITIPFSVLQYVFINSKNNYTDKELHMLMQHEYRHYYLKHTVDLFALRCIQILFWFHPLVYLFERNMLLVHEYQADEVANDHKQYSNFLIQQAFAGSIPKLAHALTYSPLKSRIDMLQKKSTQRSKYKTLLAIPVFAFTFITFSNCKNVDVQGDYAVHKNGTTATYKENTTELKHRRTDTVVHEDGTTTIHDWADETISLNGKEIYTVYQIRTKKQVDEYPKFLGQEEFLGAYLFNNLKADFEELADGKYNMMVSGIVINETGEIAYYNYSGIQRFGERLKEGEEPYMASHLDNKVTQLLYNAPKYKPATINGTSVPCEFFGIWGMGYGHPKSYAHIVVKNHKASIHYKNS